MGRVWLAMRQGSLENDQTLRTSWVAVGELPRAPSESNYGRSSCTPPIVTQILKGRRWD